MGPLKNTKHEAFCKAFVCGENAGNAGGSYRAVYGKDNRQAASKLRHRDDILRRVAELQQQRCDIETKAIDKVAEALAVDKEWVLKQLVENVQRAMQATPVLDSEREKMGEYRYDGATANRALELIGKHFGMFADRAEVGHAHNRISAEPLTPEQWAEQFGVEQKSH